MGELKTYVHHRGTAYMDPHYRSRLIAVVIAMIAICSAFSVSPVAGFRLENRDGNGTGATLAEALVMQESTKIEEAFLENVTVYIDSRSDKFEPYKNSSLEGFVNGVYSLEEDAIYLRSDLNPERADETLVQQVGFRVYHRKGLAKSDLLASLTPASGSYLDRICTLPGEVTGATVFANAFMLYYTSPELLESENPELYAYIDLLVETGGDAAVVDDLYRTSEPA